MDPDKVAKLSKFDAADYLDTPEDIALYLDAAFEDNDPQHIIQALKTIARAKGMSQVAKDAGITREGLYKALGKNGDPKLATLLGIFNALGINLSCTIAANENNAPLRKRG